MRIIVFAVVLLFCTIYFKIGWSISKYEDLSIDSQWVYILGLALVAKRFSALRKRIRMTKTKESKKKGWHSQEQEDPTPPTKGKDTSKDASQ